MNPENKASAPNNNASVPKPAMDKASHNIVMGILAYLGVLVFIPFFASKDDPFVKFHIKQGLVLFCIEVICWILTAILPLFGIIFVIVNLGTIILSILGIINAAQQKERELPLVGQYSSFFKF